MWRAAAGQGDNDDDDDDNDDNDDHDDHDRDIFWCQHVVALAVFRIRNADKVREQGVREIRKKGIFQSFFQNLHHLNP